MLPVGIPICYYHYSCIQELKEGVEDLREKVKNIESIGGTVASMTTKTNTKCPKELSVSFNDLKIHAC